jgi:hypothetical protein
MLLDFFLWGYVKDTVYKTPLTSLELKFRIVAAIETVKPQMLENTWREIEYCSDILHATKSVHVEVVKHSAVLILLSYTFIFHKQFYFVVSGLKIIGHGNPDNNLESPCILYVLFVCLLQIYSASSCYVTFFCHFLTNNQ